MSNKIKLVLENRACKHHNAFYIPIVQENNIFYTGQKLSTQKMLGDVPLTEEELKLYPYVINPLQTHKVPNGRMFDVDDITDKAIYDLIGLSEKIAPSKSEYNPSKHKGYFLDRQRDAETELAKADKFYYALKCVREMPKSSMDAVCTMLYYTTMRKDFDIEMDRDSYEVKLMALNRMARTDPDKVLNCFIEFNPGISDELFVYKLIHRGLIVKQGNEYYEAISGSAKNFMGNSLNKVKDYMSRRENDHIKGKFMNLLSEYESGQTLEIPLSRVTKDKVEHTKDFIIALIKSNILDGNIDEATKKLGELKTLTGLSEEYIDITNLVKKHSDQSETKQNSLKEELEQLPIEKLHEKIKHHKTPYNIEEITEFQNDKDLVIEYMLKKVNSK